MKFEGERHPRTKEIWSKKCNPISNKKSEFLIWKKKVRGGREGLFLTEKNG